MSYTKLYKRIQKQEIIDTILIEMRKNPKITNLQLSMKLKLHRHTISKYRKFIRQNYYKTPQETVNKIDSRLDEELEAMSHFALLMYRGQLVPKKAEIKTEITTEIKQELSVKFDEMPEDEREFCRKIARRYIKTNNQERPTSIH